MKKTFLVTNLLLLASITILGLWLWQDARYKLQAGIEIDAPFYFTIKPGMSMAAVADELHRQNILSHPHYLLLAAKLKNKDSLIRAGEYEIKPGTSPWELLELFIGGKVVQHALILLEGWTFSQVMEAINNDDKLNHTLADMNHNEIMSQLGRPGASPEGRFFPDTYHFPRGTSDAEFLLRAMNQLDKVLSGEWMNRAEGLPYQSAEEALIMASLIEKETAVPEERSLIAGVFVRRLQKGMLLQTDPTVIFAMAEKFDGNIRRKDLTIDSPYNTYLYKGLPPTPIALAGYESIHAALNPDMTSKALYFVSRGDGTHQFSETLNEHNKAVNEYQLGKND